MASKKTESVEDIEKILKRIKSEAIRYLDYVATPTAELIASQVESEPIIGLHEPPAKIEEYRRAIDLVINQLTERAARSIITRHDWEGGAFILTAYHQKDMPKLIKPHPRHVGEPSKPETWERIEYERFFNRFHAGAALLDIYVDALCNYYKPTIKDLEKRAKVNKERKHEGYEILPMYTTLNEAIRESVLTVYMEYPRNEKEASTSWAINMRRDVPPQYYLAMYQGVGLNNLSQMKPRLLKPIVDDVTGESIIKDKDFTLFIENNRNIKTSTLKLLDIGTIELTRQNDFRGNGNINSVVSIPIDRFMSLCGIPNTKPSKDKTRRKLPDDLETLFNLSISWTENSGKKTKDYAKMRLLSSQGIRKGNIIIGFSPEFASYLTHAYVMQYPTDLLKLDDRNSNSYHIGRKLTLHHSIDNNRIKKTANIIGVKTLLDICPDIPSYEEVMKGGRQVDQRIKTPFENALNILSDLNIITWQYSNSKGVPLTDEQIKSNTYTDFIALYIYFTIPNFPNQTARLTARVEEKEDKKALVKKSQNKRKKAENTIDKLDKKHTLE